MISVPPGGTVTEHTVTVKGSQLKVRAIRDVSGAVVSWNLPPALEQNLNDQTRQQLYKYLLTVTSGQQQAMPVQPRPGASPMSRQVAPVPVGVPRVPARPMPTMVAPPRPLNAANTTARVIQQTAKGLTTVMPPGGAVRPVSNAAGVAPRPPPQQQQQQQPQPQPQAPAKPSVLPSQQLVSEQIKRSWEADRRAIEAPKKSKFTSLDDAIERLLPYHLVAYPDFTVEDDDPGTKEAQNRRVDEMRQKYMDLLKKESQASYAPELDALVTRMQLDDLRTEVILLRNSMQGGVQGGRPN